MVQEPLLYERRLCDDERDDDLSRVSYPDIGKSLESDCRYVYGDPLDDMPNRSMRLLPGALSDEDVLRRSYADFCTQVSPSCIDVGAGLGRLLPVLSEWSSCIVAIEPDLKRFERMAQMASLLRQRGKNVDAVHCGAAEYRKLQERRFDFAVCSHVMAHVGQSIRKEILAALAGVVLDDGIAIVTTPTVRRSTNDRYMVCSDPSGDGSALVRMLDSFEFERAVSNPRKGRLPVWHPTTDGFGRELMGAGFALCDVLNYRQFEFAAHDLNGRHVTLSAVDTAYILRRR